MGNIKKIKNKSKLISIELREWAETFSWELDEEDERTTKSRDYLYSLAERLENNKCSKKDFESIIFNIKQINYNEIRIQL